MAVPPGSQVTEPAVFFSPIESETAGLEFVTVLNPKDVLTASNQKRIRRHARKSVRGTGRWRRKIFSRTYELTRSEFPTNPTTSRQLNPFSSGVGSYSTDDSLPVIPIRGLDDQSQFPVETTTRMRELVSFSCHKATTIHNPTFRYWFRIALTDPSAFYMTLSSAALELAQRCKGESGQLDENNEALSLYNLSLQSVSIRLQDSSDSGTLVAILGFACRDVSTGNTVRSVMHLRGLGRVLHARESLLTQTSTDFQTILIEIDVYNAFAQDACPLFPAPRDLCQDIFDHYLSSSSPVLDATLQLWLDRFPGDADIISAFRWVAVLTMFVNENSSMPQFWMEDKVVNMTLVTLHRSLSLKHYDSSMKTGLELDAREVIRLALIVFLGNFMRRVGFSHRRNAAVYCNKIKGLIDYPLDWSVLMDLQLWAVIVCGMEQSQSAASQEWYSHKIASIMLQMGLRDWGSALNIIRGLIWIDDIAPDRLQTLGAAAESQLNQLINGSSSPI